MRSQNSSYTVTGLIKKVPSSLTLTLFSRSECGAPAPELDQHQEQLSYSSPLPALLHGLHVDDLPDWAKLPHLVNGYRLGGSYGSCLASLFTMHNQTWNAWTMVLGALCSCYLLLHTLFERHPEMHPSDQLVFGCMTLSVLLHVPFSVCFHLFQPMGNEIYRTWRALDMSFIYVASCLLTFSLAYYVLPGLLTVALTSVAVAAAARASRVVGNLRYGRTVSKSQNTRFLATGILLYLLPVIWGAAAE